MKVIYSAIAAVFLAGTAGAATLDFSGNICNGGGACGGRGGGVDQSYGDMTGVDVVYDGDSSTAGDQDVFHWGSGYEDLSAAIWTNVGDALSVSFVAQAGYEVTVSSFDIAPYANRVKNTLVRVVDMAGGPDLYNTTYAPISTVGVTTIAGSFTSDTGIQLLLGPDAYDVGMSNIQYSVQAIQTNPATVPLPAAGWMLLAGLGGLVAASRRRG